MIEATEGEILSDLERARRELEKLGIHEVGRIDERVYEALLELPPKLGRAVYLRDLLALFEVPRHTVMDALDRLRERGMVLHPRQRGPWVAVTE